MSEREHFEPTFSDLEEAYEQQQQELQSALRKVDSLKARLLDATKQRDSLKRRITEEGLPEYDPLVTIDYHCRSELRASAIIDALALSSGKVTLERIEQEINKCGGILEVLRTWDLHSHDGKLTVAVED